MGVDQPGRQIRTWGLIVMASVSLWLTLVSTAAAETIERFEVDILVQPTGQLQVTETIVYDFGTAERHGIYRDLNGSHPQPSTSWFTDRYVEYDLDSITRNGATEPYEATADHGLSVRIGDPDVTISGEHTYEIRYTIDGAIATYETGPELYWNITGHDWTVPIHDVAVTVRGAEDVSLSTEQVCYVGVFGSTERCEAALVGEIATFAQPILSPGEGVTIAQRVVLPGTPIVLERLNLLPFLVIVGIVWFIGLFVYLWRWRFFYKRKESIIAQYEPYRGFKPLFTGVLFDNRLDNRDITAGIIYLAEQGFLTIKQTEEKVLFFFETNDYEITLTRDSNEVETESQRTLLSLFNLSTIGQTVKLSSIKKDQKKLMENLKIVHELRKRIETDLVAEGFIEQQKIRGLKVGLVIAAIVLAINLMVVGGTFFGPAGVVLVILVVVSILLWLLLGLERRTARGYEALNYLKGFKDFLSTTEKERYTFHNAPARNAEQFMEYLPYAIAFGVEKEWAEVFNDIDMAPPSWYSAPHNASFNAAVLTSDLSNFSSAVAGSTGPSGSSGSGGGGSAGGGGGGGGGGSW